MCRLLFFPACLRSGAVHLRTGGLGMYGTALKSWVDVSWSGVMSPISGRMSFWSAFIRTAGPRWDVISKRSGLSIAAFLQSPILPGSNAHGATPSGLSWFRLILIVLTPSGLLLPSC